MLNIHFCGEKKKKDPTSTKRQYQPKSLSERIEKTIDLCNFSFKNYPYMGRNIIFKKKIDYATAEYLSELQALLKVGNQRRYT